MDEIDVNVECLMIKRNATSLMYKVYPNGYTLTCIQNLSFDIDKLNLINTNRQNVISAMARYALQFIKTLYCNLTTIFIIKTVTKFY